MNLDEFITADDSNPLIPLLIKFAGRYPDAHARQDVLAGMGVDKEFFLTWNVTGAAYQFACVLLRNLRDFTIADERPDYHPLEVILAHFRNFPAHIGLDAREIALCDEYLAIFRDKLKAGAVRANVARLETVPGAVMGTGVYLGRGLLLTCGHVFSGVTTAQVRVRFGYYHERSFSKNWNVYEAEPEFVSYASVPDHALLKLKTAPARTGVQLFPGNLGSAPQAVIRMMHHPLGKPLIISAPGRIWQVGDDFICHDIPAEKHSSGAPIFNENWELVAIHRGEHFSRDNFNRTGTLEALPIHALIRDLTKHLQP